MFSKIVIIIEGPHHVERIQSIMAETSRAYTIYSVPTAIGECQEVVNLAREVILQGTSVIISSGRFAEAIMSQTGIPVVIIKPSRYSFEQAIMEAMKISSKVAIAGRKGIYIDAANQWKTIFKHDIPIVSFQTEADTVQVLDQLKTEGFEVVITATNFARLYADNIGLKHIGVPFEKDDVIQTFKQAEHILDFIEERTRNAETLRIIQNAVSDGIVAVDASGLVAEINTAALEIVKAERTAIQGHPIADTVLAPLGNWIDFGTPKARQGEIISIQATTLSVSVNPVVINGVAKAFVLSLVKVEQLQKTEQDIRLKLHNKGHVAQYTFERMIGSSDPHRQAVTTAKQFARVDSTVLIYGQSGTGKEVFAQSIHNASRRKNMPFVVINCAALPESLLESILFGYEKGAFTGASSEGRVGLFELAHGGTVFLDEISEMPLSIQARFLRVLQEKEVMPVGSSRVIPVDIRIISATNKDLYQLVLENKFREDLYYRIGVLWLNIPSLDQRRDDISRLAKYFFYTKLKELQLHIEHIEPEGIDFLSSLNYPGNIRQLSNFIERAVVINEGPVLTLDTLKTAVLSSQSATRPMHSQTDGKTGSQIDSKTDSQANMQADGIHPLRPAVVSEIPDERSSHTPVGSTESGVNAHAPLMTRTVWEQEKRLILDTLRECKNDRARTAQKLGISTITLWRKMKRHEIQAD